MNRTLWTLSLFLLVQPPITGCRVLMDIPDQPEATCGNASRESGEQCDGTDIGEASCATQGFLGGILTCAADCTWNTELCFNADPCGDGSLDLGEDCDGANLDGQTCLGLGYYSGELACANDCTFDLASCEAAGRCGDGIIQAANGETCDGANLDGQTCLGLGYYGGTLACANACTFDRASCEAAGRCGDGILQAADGETCDGANLDGQTCLGLGYYGGTLACTNGCTLNLGSCEAAGRCGDGIIQAADGETCDGANLDGMTCTDLGYCGGTLACKNTCIFLTTGCSNDMCK